MDRTVAVFPDGFARGVVRDGNRDPKICKKISSGWNKQFGFLKRDLKWVLIMHKGVVPSLKLT